MVRKPDAKLPHSSAPKHERVRELLRRRIHQGIYLPGARLPTESELPRQLKVGNQTIRHALNDLVREGLIVRRRGSGSFVADRRHRPLLPGRALKLAMLWPQSVWPERMRSTFHGAISLGVLEALGLEVSAAAWSLAEPTETTRASWTDKARKLQVDCLGEAAQGHPRHPPLRDIRAGHYDGILVLGIIEEPFLDALLRLGVPTVLVDVLNERFLARADQIFVDPCAGYRQAVRHFAERGMRRIHFVPGYIGRPAPAPDATQEERGAYARNPMRVDPDSHLRQSAYRQGMDDCGLPVAEEWIHHAASPRRHGEELTLKLLSLPPQRRPEALIAHQAGLAETLIEAYARKGWTLLGAGAGEPENLQRALPIRIDTQSLGEIAVELLTARLQRPGRPCLRVGVPMLLQGRAEVSSATLAAHSERGRPVRNLEHAPRK